MRWLIFLDTDHVSGPARLALDFAVAARRGGHDVQMLGLVRGPALPNAFSRAVEAAGVPVKLLRERFRFDPAIFAQFGRLLDKFKPDIYQSHGYKGSMLGRMAQRRGARWQAMFHGFTWESRLMRLYHRLDVRWLRRADEVIVVARSFGRELARRGVDPGRIRWIANAIDEDALRATDSGAELRPSLSGENPRDILAGVIGRMSPEKGPDIFIRAMAQVPASVRAAMIGDGPQLDACRRLATTLGVHERIVMPGFRSDLAAIYRALDMLVIPSRSEGLPTVMIEAMLMGVPLISTAVGAVPDVIEDGATALMVPPNDEAALARAIERLAGDRALRQRLAAAGREFARGRLTVGRRADEIIEHARCLLADEPLPPEKAIGDF